MTGLRPRQRIPRLPDPDRIVGRADVQRDHTPPAQDRARRRRLLDHSAVQHRGRPVGIRTLAEESEIVCAEPGIECLSTAEVRYGYAAFGSRIDHITSPDDHDTVVSALSPSFAGFAMWTSDSVSVTNSRCVST